MSVDSCFAGSASEQTAKKLLELSRGSSPTPSESKLPSVIDGSVTTLTAEDFGDATSIRDYAFAHLKSLLDIYIPDTVTFIGERAFENCTNATVYLESLTPPALGDESGKVFDVLQISVPSDTYNTYVTEWPEVASIIVPRGH